MGKKLFSGAGGGPDTPTQTPDNLFSEDVIEFALAVSEGPIRGLSNGAKSFYVGSTPLVGVDGVLNFQKFAIGVHPGYPEGVAKPLQLQLGGETSNYTVGVKLQTGVPVTRQTDATVRNRVDQLEVRINFQRLLVQNNDGTFQNTAQFQLQYKPSKELTWRDFYSNGVISITGKTSSGYIREFRTNVPRIDDDWQVRVTKVSPDSTDSKVCDITFDGFQATSLGAKAYPDTAIVHGLGVSNGSFSSLPEFTGVYDGLICRVPSNYNPDTRTYDESVPWNGALKFAWTNNPAWILYEMIVNPRFGLAAYRLHIDANRFDFYLAGKWCDEPVEVLGGGTRPRFTFNGVITEPRPGMEFLNYIAGSFNALVWDDLQGQIHLKVDKDDPAVMMFSPENVTVDGFNYAFTDTAIRANDISVSFINPELEWNQDRRRIPGVTTNEEAIAKYGRVPLDFIAVGCTDPNEAIAKAQVRLISAQTETTMVNFTTIRQGALLTLFDVILIADPTMGWSQSGRITSYDDNYIYFRDPIFMEEMKPYVVKVQAVTGIVEVTAIPETIGHVTRLMLQQKLPSNLPRHTVFTVEEEGNLGFAKPFRVTAIEESDDQYQYRISAIEINRNKYLLSESSTPLTEFQYSYKNPALPGAPTNFSVVSGDDHLLVDPTGRVIPRIYASWKRPFGQVVDHYELQWRLASDDVWQSKTTQDTAEYISEILAGDSYFVRVRSVNPLGRNSPWATVENYKAVGKTLIPANVTSFTATGGLFMNSLKWTYGTAPDIRSVEIWQSADNQLLNASKLTDLNYPQTSFDHLGLGLGMTVFYWIRLVDTSGNKSTFSNMVSATTSTDPSQILKLLTGQITEANLFKDLSSRIDLIDGPDTLENSVAYRLKSTSQTLGAAIESESQARATSEQAIAQSLVTLSSTIGENTTAIQTQATTIDGLSAQYTVKVDNNGYVSGYGLASTMINGVPTSEFVILADKFAIVTPGQAKKMPFVIGTVNGATTVGINGALVVDGTISATKLVVNNLSAISATIGTLRTAVTGERTEISDNVIKVFDAGNVVRVQIGNLNA